MSGLGADLQPAGWRLTDAPGRRPPAGAQPARPGPRRRSRSRRRDYAGAFKIQVAGPWTLAATVEKPRGDKVLSDHGARRELAQALAEGVRDHVADVRRRLPRRRPAGRPGRRAGAGRGAGRRRCRPRPASAGTGRSHPPEASEALEWVLGAIAEAGAEPWVHTLRRRVRRSALLARRRAPAASRSTSTCCPRPTTTCSREALERGRDGRRSASYRPPTRRRRPRTARSPSGCMRWLDMLGLDPATSRRAAGAHADLRAGRRVACVVAAGADHGCAKAAEEPGLSPRRGPCVVAPYATLAALALARGCGTETEPTGGRARIVAEPAQHRAGRRSHDRVPITPRADRGHRARPPAAEHLQPSRPCTPTRGTLPAPWARTSVRRHRRVRRGLAQRRTGARQARPGLPTISHCGDLDTESRTRRWSWSGRSSSPRRTRAP